MGQVALMAKGVVLIGATALAAKLVALAQVLLGLALVTMPAY